MVYHKRLESPSHAEPRHTWFKDAAVGKILNVELPSEQHLYWPELDIDLEIDSILHPERYPLVSRVQETGEEYGGGTSNDDWDKEKAEDAVLALFQLTLHAERRAWKGFDFEILDRLFDKGLILDPRNRSKSVVLTDEGLARSEKLFEQMFGTPK
jgi:hypothetical protein